MSKLNKTCFLCQQQYSYCYSCPTELQYQSWKNLFDTENCKEIFNILCRHGQSTITDEEAKELLEQYDLSQKDSFTDNVKKHIDQIFCASDKETSNKEIADEIVQPIKPKKMRPKHRVVKDNVADK